MSITAHKVAPAVTDEQFKKYGRVIRAWQNSFDTDWIAKHCDLPEELVARWVANYQDMKHGAAA